MQESTVGNAGAMDSPRFGTLAVHDSGQLAPSRPLTPALVRSSAFLPGGGWSYSRLGNPTVTALEARLAGLDRAERSLACSSGSAALTCSLLTLVPLGGRVVAASQICADSAHVLVDEMGRLGRGVVFCDIDDEEAWQRELAHPLATVAFAEAIANPTLRVADIPRLVQVAAVCEAALVVDGTVATPANMAPLDMGADLVLHSAGKYLNGHSDLVAGVASGSERLIESIRTTVRTIGCPISPDDAALLLRGLLTLDVRMQRHNQSGLAVAEWLRTHPQVQSVSYPLLEGSPDIERSRTLLGGGSGVVLVQPVGGDARVRALAGLLRTIQTAPTFGGVESLVALPEPGPHWAHGIPAGSFRLSVGLEHVDDLLDDLERALSMSGDISDIGSANAV
jgi:cystathionine beta-lyase/cystathionine gamma-synthase